jgi:hypothetical protein
LVVIVFISLIILALAVLGFDLLASRFGVDTRDGDDWNRHPSDIA